MQGYLCIDLLQFLDQSIFICHRSSGNDIHRFLDGIELLRNFPLLLYPDIVFPVDLRNLTQVAGTRWWNNVYFFRSTHCPLEIAFPVGKLFPKGCHDQGIKSIHAGIVELGSHGTHYRQILLLAVPKVVVADVLLAHIAQGIQGSALVKLVERNQVCKVQHVDFLQLGCCPILRSHHVERQVGMLNDFGVGLADAGGFKDDQIVARRLDRVHGILHVLGKGQIGLAGGQGTHVDARMMDGIHANSVTEQGSTCLSLGRIHGNNGYASVFKVK